MTILTNSATPLAASSGNVAAAVASAVLPGTAGRMTYITGFQITGAGATAPAVVTATVSSLGTPGATTLSYAVTAATGATVANTPLTVQFDVPLPAVAMGTAITVSCPSLGAGNTNNVVNAVGYAV